MDDKTKSLPATPLPQQQLSPVRRDACLVHIHPTGPKMGTRYTLGDARLVLGRDPSCDIVIDDDSVSRRHACIKPSYDGYQVEDLQSRNGTFVNEQSVNAEQLNDGDYLRIGNSTYRFLAGDNLELQYHEEIHRLSILDALTEVPNKRHFLDFLGRQLSSATRHDRPLALIIFDIDHFKSVNDMLGHLAGDNILRELAALVKRGIRKEDMLARYGGEEFVLVLPETERQGALELAEHLRRRVEVYPFNYNGRNVAVTISLGVAVTAGSSPMSADELIYQADEKLYEAKNGGRNRVSG
jgi:diguanylate cyclase (GGDEF)-like protein